MVDAFAPAALCRVYSRLQLMAVELQPTVPRPAGGDPTFRRPRAGSGAALYAGLAVDYHPPAPSRPLRPANGRRAHPAGGLSAAVGFLCQRGVIRRRPTRRRLAAVNAGGWFCHAAHPRPDAVSARSQGSDPAVRRGVDAGRPLRSARHRRRVRGVSREFTARSFT